jgi:hypothetical protein
MNAERIFAALLRLYPKSFQEEYGDAMLAGFRELRAARCESRARFWRFIVDDTIRAAATLWWDECRQSFALRWLMTCVVGLSSTAFVANVVVWVLSYLYHPYLEGLSVSASAYGAFFGVVLGGTIAMSQSFLLPRQDPRSWALASAVALPISALLCGTAIDRAVMGMNPVAERALHDALSGWIGLLEQRDPTEVLIEFAAMALSAAVFAAATRRQMERRHAC